MKRKDIVEGQDYAIERGKDLHYPTKVTVIDTGEWYDKDAGMLWSAYGKDVEHTLADGTKISSRSIRRKTQHDRATHVWVREENGTVRAVLLAHIQMLWSEWEQVKVKRDEARTASVQRMKDRAVEVESQRQQILTILHDLDRLPYGLEREVQPYADNSGLSGGKVTLSFAELLRLLNHASA